MMVSTFRALATVAAASLGSLALACHSSPPPPTTGTGTVNGMISGISLPVKDSISFFVIGTQGGTAFNTLIIVLGDAPNLCSVAHTGGQSGTKASFISLTLILQSQAKVAGQPPPPVSPGTYEILPSVAADGAILPAPPIEADAQFQETDAQCMNTLNPLNTDAVGGTIELDAVSATGASGSFTLRFNGGVIDGTFASAGCEPPSDDASVVCVP
jgi:hypothetical protein